MSVVQLNSSRTAEKVTKSFSVWEILNCARNFHDGRNHPATLVRIAGGLAMAGVRELRGGRDRFGGIAGSLPRAGTTGRAV
jgi:hypothetical protein